MKYAIIKEIGIFTLFT